MGLPVEEFVLMVNEIGTVMKERRNKAKMRKRG